MTVSRPNRRRASHALRVATPLLMAALALGEARCGFLASPGEYANGDDNGGDASDGSLGPDDSMPGDSTVTLPDGYVVPQSVGTIALMAGARDPSSADDNPAWSADAWSGVLDSNGHVASWKIGESAPVIGTFVSSGLVGGKWMLLNNGFGIDGNRGTALQETSWSPGIAGDWVADNALGAPGGLSDYSTQFYGANLAYVGGTRSGTNDAGAFTYFTQEVHTSTVDPVMNQLGASVGLGQTLLHARSNPALAFGKIGAYVIGGRTYTGFFGSVEMAPVDSDAGAFSAFVDQPTMMTAGAEHKVFLPSVAIGNGFLFVSGGRVPTAATPPPTDVVLSASIDGTTGALGTWQTVNQLPAPLYSHALVAFKGRLYAIGGVGATTRSDQVYSAKINGDGTIGAWATDAKLPAARSDFAALAY